MSIKINYQNNISNKSQLILSYLLMKISILMVKKIYFNSEFSYISDLLKTSDLKKDLLFFEINSKKTVFLVSIKKDIKISDIENLGAKFHSYINYDKKK